MHNNPPNSPGTKSSPANCSVCYETSRQLREASGGTWDQAAVTMRS